MGKLQNDHCDFAVQALPLFYMHCDITCTEESKFVLQLSFSYSDEIVGILWITLLLGPIQDVGYSI